MKSINSLYLLPQRVGHTIPGERRSHWLVVRVRPPAHTIIDYPSSALTTQPNLELAPKGRARTFYCGDVPGNMTAHSARCQSGGLDRDVEVLGGGEVISGSWCIILKEYYSAPCAQQALDVSTHTRGRLGWGSSLAVV